jgi:hypothetical protein
MRIEGCIRQQQMILQYITPAGWQKTGLKERNCFTIGDEIISPGFALRHLAKEAKDACPGVRSLIPRIQLNH